MLTAKILYYSDEHNNDYLPYPGGDLSKSSKSFVDARVGVRSSSAGSQFVYDPDSVTGPDNGYYRFETTPVQGFTFDGWFKSGLYNPSTTVNFNGNLSQNTTLIPAYHPTDFMEFMNYYDNKIDVTVSGDSNADIDISLSNFLGFYTENIDSAGVYHYNDTGTSTTGVTYVPDAFPNGDVNDYPNSDGLTDIILKIRQISGYNINITSTIKHGDLPAVTTTLDNGPTEDGYITKIITNTSHGDITGISITYIPVYTIEVTADGPGVVSLRLHDNGAVAGLNDRSSNDIESSASESSVTPSNVQDETTVQTSITVTDETVLDLIATPNAGAQFVRWRDGSGTTSTNNPYQYTVNGSDDTIEGKFVSTDPKIYVNPNNTTMGSVEIHRYNGGPTGQSLQSPVSASQTTNDKLHLQAAPTSGYMFSYWTREYGDGSIDTGYRNTDNAIVVNFGDVDTKFVAIFVPDGSQSVSLFTSVNDSPSIQLQSGGKSDAVTVEYTNYNNETTTVTFGYTPINIASKVVTESGQEKIIVTLNAVDRYYPSNDGRQSNVRGSSSQPKYRYRFLYYKYCVGAAEVGGSYTWYDLTSTGNTNEYSITLDSQTPGPITITAVYEYEQVYDMVVSPVSLNNPQSNIGEDVHIVGTCVIDGVTTGDDIVDGHGTFPAGSVVTLTTTDSSDRYHIYGWTINDVTVQTSSNVSIVNMTSDITATSNYYEYFLLSFSVSGGAVGTTIAGYDVTASEELTTGFYQLSGHTYKFTVTPVGSDEVGMWTVNGGSQSSETHNINEYASVLYGDTTIVAYIDNGHNVLTLSTSDNGDVKVEAGVSGTFDIISPVSTVGNVRTYNIGLDKDVRLTAEPYSSSYKFYQYISTSNSTGVEYIYDNIYLIEDFDEDYSVSASFRYIPWSERIGTIIKVF